jgi:hypothetical protein
MLYGVLAKREPARSRCLHVQLIMRPVYANSILVSLNTRQSSQQNDGGTVQTDSSFRNPMSAWSGAQSQPGRVFVSALDTKASSFEADVLKTVEVC